MIAAVIQFLPIKGNPDKNLELIFELLTQCTSHCAELIILPEMCLTGYVWNERERLVKLSEPADGRTFQALSSYCSEHRSFLAYGFAEYCKVKLYNSQNLIGPKGDLLATYRKVHLYETDSLWANSGDGGFVSVNTEIGRLGLGICMDLNFNDFISFHCKQQTDLLLLSTNWLDEGYNVHDYWLKRLFPFSGISLIANSAGVDELLAFSGCSGAFLNNRCLKSATKNSPEIIYIEM